MTVALEQLYGGQERDAQLEEFDAVLSESLYPRGPETLVELFRELGVRAGEEVLCLGGADISHAIDLTRRYDCRMIVVDPAPQHLARAAEAIRAAGLEGRVIADFGDLDALPIQSEAVDHVWARDMLLHADLPRALAEVSRVMRPGGGLLTHLPFATPLLEPAEFRRITSALRIPGPNLSLDYFEQTCRRTGFHLVRIDRLDSEWQELSLEDGDLQVVDDLLKIARLRRMRDSLLTHYGEDRYEVMYARLLWRLYELLGKLCPIVHLLRKPY